MDEIVVTARNLYADSGETENKSSDNRQTEAYIAKLAEKK